MKYFIIFLVLLRDHPILSVFGIIGLGFLGLLLLPRKIKRPYVILAISMFVIFIFNMLLGNIIINQYLYRYGENGEGIIIDVTQTASRHNHQTVLRYDVVLKSTESETYSTYFYSSDFNIFPTESWNMYRYPTRGIKFNVRYLKEKPRIFVIIGDDNSEYCQWLGSLNNSKEINRIKNQLKFDPDNAELKKKLERLLHNSASPGRR